MRITTLLCLAAFALCATSPAAAQSSSRLQLVIVSAVIESGNTLVIEGQNFVAPNDAAVTVTLGDDQLVVGAFSNTLIQALLPPDMAPGTYLLRVSRGNSVPQNGSAYVNVGAAGPAGATGAQGPIDRKSTRLNS